MTHKALMDRVREVIAEAVPLPGRGETAERHRRLFEVGCEDLSLARLVEAHWDAVAILSEAGRDVEPGVLYGVWSAEAPGSLLRMDGLGITGSKPFCSGAGLIDRALVTVRKPTALLVDIDLRAQGERIRFDDSAWVTKAFAETKTSEACFAGVTVKDTDTVGAAGFYLERPGFWHGACGPAACWAGGAAGLLNWALEQRRLDAHTLAHLGAMSAAVWSIESALKSAADEIDVSWDDIEGAQVRALRVRHVVEQECTEVLRRLTRAYGPHPLARDERISKRYQELDLYVRQSHAERDLEALGRLVHRNE